MAVFGYTEATIQQATNRIPCSAWVSVLTQMPDTGSTHSGGTHRVDTHSGSTHTVGTH